MYGPQAGESRLPNLIRVTNSTILALIRIFTARRSNSAHNIEQTHVEPSNLTIRCLHHDADKQPVSETKDVHESGPSARIVL